MNVWSVVVAAGKGTRFGAAKQLEGVLDRRVVDWSVDLLASFGPVVLVGPAPADATSRDSISASSYFRSDDASSAAAMSKVEHFAFGGSSRSASVRAGLDSIAESATHVLVHDAARPLVTGPVVERVLRALEGGADGAIPVVPVVDTLQTVDGESVDRSRFVAVQTPQGFALDKLRRAHESEADATDDSALVVAMGGNVVHVAGDVQNLKVTAPHDIQIAESILRMRC